MKNLNVNLLLLLLLGFTMMGLEAQQALPATGGDASGASGTVSYTLGQVWYTTMTDTEFTISQGVQQPFEILEITGIQTAPGMTLNASVFPNPVGESAILRVEDHALEGLSFQLYNMNGDLLERRLILDTETRIPLSHLGPATFLIRITRHREEIKTFKIIKK